MTLRASPAGKKTAPDFHPAALRERQELERADSLEAIYQVHKNLRPDGVTNNVDDEFIANLQEGENCPGHYIKLSVDPSGRTYTVSLPHRKHTRTFTTKNALDAKN